VIASESLPVALGIALGMVFYGRTGLSCGGILSPGLLALQAFSPEPVAVTLLWALALLPCIEGAVRAFGLYGRQRTAFALLAAALLRALLSAAFPLVPAPLSTWIGWVVPGLVAADMQRQGVFPTAAALVTVTALTALLGGLLP